MQQRDDTEFSVEDWMKGVKDYWYWLVGLPIAFIIIAFILSVLLPKRWEAQATVKIAHIGALTSTGQGYFLEPFDHVKARIHSKAFRDEIAKRLGIPIDPNNGEYALLTNSLRVEGVEGLGFATITLEGYSQDKALQYIQTVINRLIEVHTRIAVPILANLHAEGKLISEQLKQTQQQIKRLRAMMAVPPAGGTNAVERFLIANLLASEQGRLTDLEGRQLRYMEQSSPSQTYPTALLGSIFISHKPVFPKEKFNMLLGGILGLLLGGIIVLFKAVRRA